MIIMKDLYFLVLIMTYCSMELLELNFFFLGWVCGVTQLEGERGKDPKFKNM